MTTLKTTTSPFLLAVRWTARISSIIFIGVFILMFLGEGFEPDKITPREWVSLFFFPLGLIAGMILAWWKEGLGGAMMVGSLIAELFVGDVSGSGGGYMLICASPGFLFLLAWFLSKIEEMPAHEEGAAQMSTPLASVTEILETRKAHIEAGLCPKCGVQVKPTEQNCPSCRINLAFARTHLDQW